MKTVWTIFKKELTDTLRDRRTIIMMMVVPLLMIYAFMSLSTRISAGQTRKAMEKELKVGLVANGNGAAFRDRLAEVPGIKIMENIDPETIEQQVRNRDLDYVVVFDGEFDRRVAEGKTGNVELYYKASRAANISIRRIVKPLEQYKKDLLALRLSGLDLDQAFIQPLEIKRKDLASQKERIGESIGGFLPYIFVIFCFLGAMYPAIDLAAGEKERATIETLLTSPAGRLQIVTGKFMVVTLAGLVSAMVSILALYLSIKQAAGIPQKALDALLRIIEWKSIGLLLSLLFPLCVFFAGALLSVSVFARSFKEAQSIVAPLNFIVIIPVFIGIFPGIKLNAATALIPILNVSLATREIISGTIQTGFLLETYLSLFLLAGLSLVFCAWWFKREDVIFRGI